MSAGGSRVKAVDVCAACGFDGNRWNDPDTIHTISMLPGILGHWLQDLADDDWDRRPQPDVWSIGEYVHHIGDALTLNRMGIELSLAEPGFDMGAGIVPTEPGAAQVIDRAVALGRIEESAKRLVKVLGTVAPEQWEAAIVMDGIAHDITWGSRHVVHDTWHHFVDIARIREQLGDPIAVQAGTLEQINSSNGGVPKTAVAEAAVGFAGVEGDVQKVRRHHGRPWQALCLWSADVIEALQAEGHPIAAGAAGENFTLRGIDWTQLRAGAVLKIGTITCQLSAPAIPCSKNAQWFADGDPRRMAHEMHPGWSRWYASVLSEGVVAAGDSVAVAGPVLAKS